MHYMYLEHTSAHEYTAMRPQKWFHHIVQTQSGFNLLFSHCLKLVKGGNHDHESQKFNILSAIRFKPIKAVEGLGTI